MEKHARRCMASSAQTFSFSSTTVSRFLVIPTLLISIGSSLQISRSDFLLSSTNGLWLPHHVTSSAYRTRTIDPFRPSSSSATETITLPLRRLPISGCLVTPISIGNNNDSSAFRYLAVIDTGSPFLTAPREVLERSKEADKFPPSAEQYGESKGSMQWRDASVHFERQYFAASLVLGIPTENISEESGGPFLGLMDKDDYHPTVMNQLGYRSFCLDLQSKQQPQLHMSGSTLIESSSTAVLDMYDLSPYGSNLHHYAVKCHGISFQTLTGESIRMENLKRPIVVVLDSGLTGCILSDSWKVELPIPIQTIIGASIHLDDHSPSLLSDHNYWYLSCFRLPWFESLSKRSNGPHIVGAGMTFLSRSKFAVDTGH